MMLPQKRRAPRPKTTLINQDTCPQVIADALPHRFAFSRAERRILARPKKIGPVDWVEKNRIVTHGSLKGSPMSMRITPHMRGQLEAAFFPSVRAIIVCAGPQTAKTTLTHSAIAYGLDMHPGPVLSIYPNQQAAREASGERVQKMINDSPRLRAMKTGSQDDMSLSLITLQHLSWYFGWSGSAMSMSDRSIKYLDLQEVDKYPPRPNDREAGVIEFAEIRVTAFPYDHKIFITSTPTKESGPIWQALTKDSQVIFEYYGRCPHCGEMELINLTGIKWPRGKDGHSAPYLDIKADKSAWYECSHCAHKWDDATRDHAMRSGRWYARSIDGRGELITKYLETHRPARIGFHQPSWISRFVSLSTIAADFLAAQDQEQPRSVRRRLLHNFTNKHEALPVLENKQIRRESSILSLADDRPMGIVPGNGQVAALVAGVDIHKHNITFVIRAIGWGVSPTSWQVRFGLLHSDPAGSTAQTDFDKLRQVLFEDVYQDTDGNRYQIQRVVIDSAYRGYEVHAFVHRYPGLAYSYKGAPGRRSKPYSEVKIDTWPGSTTPIPGGVIQLTVDSHKYKDDLSGLLQNQPGEPGCWYMCADITDDYARQMTAEYLDEDKNMWICPEGKANHFWDCEVYALVAADHLKIKFWPKPAEINEEPAVVTVNSDFMG